MGSREADRPGKIFVGGLPDAYGEQQLEKAFARFGKITEVLLIKDRNTSKSRGYGFVTFENPQDGSDAVKLMDGKTLDGRTIKCAQANKPADGPRGRGGGMSDRGMRGRGGPPRGGFGARENGGMGYRGRGGPPGRGFGHGRRGGGFSQDGGYSMDRDEGSFGQEGGRFGRESESFGEEHVSFGRERVAYGRESRGGSLMQGRRIEQPRPSREESYGEMDMYGAEAHRGTYDTYVSETQTRSRFSPPEPREYAPREREYGRGIEDVGYTEVEDYGRVMRTATPREEYPPTRRDYPPARRAEPQISRRELLSAEYPESSLDYPQSVRRDYPPQQRATREYGASARDYDGAAGDYGEVQAGDYDGVSSDRGYGTSREYVGGQTRSSYHENGSSREYGASSREYPPSRDHYGERKPLIPTPRPRSTLDGYGRSSYDAEGEYDSYDMGSSRPAFQTRDPYSSGAPSRGLVTSRDVMSRGGPSSSSMGRPARGGLSSRGPPSRAPISDREEGLQSRGFMQSVAPRRASGFGEGPPAKRGRMEGGPPSRGGSFRGVPRGGAMRGRGFSRGGRGMGH